MYGSLFEWITFTLPCSCWMKPEAIVYSVLVPIGIALVANIAVFVMVIYGLTCGRVQMRTSATPDMERKLAFLHLRAAISVFIVLGQSAHILGQSAHMAIA